MTPTTRQLDDSSKLDLWTEIFDIIEAVKWAFDEDERGARAIVVVQHGAQAVSILRGFVSVFGETNCNFFFFKWMF